MKTFRAFTMIELIFIIVVVGILAAVAIPRIERNGLIEAADQLASHIRYTQQLALSDNRFNANARFWHRQLWQISFNGTSYAIYSDRNVNNVSDAGEYAVDPMNPAKFLASAGNGINATNQNTKLNLANTYSIANITLGGACQGRNNIGFDFKGRPMAVAAGELYTTLYRAACTITLRNEAGQTATIFVQPETGYVGATATDNPAGGDIAYTGL